jgi:GAF domain
MSVDEPSVNLRQGARIREEEIAATFVMLADTLVDDFDVVEFSRQPGPLVRQTPRGYRGRTAAQRPEGQPRRRRVVASSSEESRLLEICQLQSDAGPCLDCVSGGASVISGDLEKERDRWPAFVAAAVDAGFRSVFAVPMRLREQSIGGLNLFGSKAGLANQADRGLAQAFADVATIGIIQQRSAQLAAGRAVTARAQQPDHGRTGEGRARRTARSQHGSRVQRATSPRAQQQSVGRRGTVRCTRRDRRDQDRRKPCPGLRHRTAAYPAKVATYPGVSASLGLSPPRTGGDGRSLMGPTAIQPIYQADAGTIVLRDLVEPEGISRLPETLRAPAGSNCWRRISTDNAGSLTGHGGLGHELFLRNCHLSSSR